MSFLLFQQVTIPPLHGVQDKASKLNILSELDWSEFKNTLFYKYISFSDKMGLNPILSKVFLAGYLSAHTLSHSLVCEPWSCGFD